MRLASHKLPVATRVITRDSQGRITNRTMGTVFKAHADAYVGSCKMPSWSDSGLGGQPAM